MSFARIIPVLLLNEAGLVKTKNFKNPVYIGDPINAVRIFNEKEVDELLLLDIYVSTQEHEPNYFWIREIVSESFMPLGYGGGIKSLDQIKKLFDIGIEKVIISSSMFNFALIGKAANIFGSQSIVVCIDTRKTIFGYYQVFTKSGRIKHKVSPVSVAKQVVDSGAGEIIIQSIDKEGTMKGYDIELTRSVSNAVDVPVVASGGAGEIEHFQEAIYEGNASAVAAGSLFVFKGKKRGILINYPPKEIIKQVFNNE
jgi:imidazole glycerol-phosphate synthase subunit HisF